MQTRNFLKIRVIGMMLIMGLSCNAYAVSRNLAVVSSTASGQKRVALVMGNSEYQGVQKLPNPVNDARSMAEALSKLGFQVTEVTNATQKEMYHAISGFGENLSRDTIALFYYAGHGLQAKGKNYLVPVDAQITGEASIPSETVEVDAILSQLESSNLSIIILDACRNNPFQKARSIGNGGLAQMDAPKGSFIAYATSPGKTANDGKGSNGLYTQELLKQIRMPGLALEEVFKRVRANVAAATDDAQVPWESTSLTGSFYFSGKPDQANQPAVDPEELAMWNKVKTSTNQMDYDIYLAKYPNGQFVAVARSAKSGLEEVSKRRAQDQRQYAETSAPGKKVQAVDAHDERAAMRAQAEKAQGDLADELVKQPSGNSAQKPSY